MSMHTLAWAHGRGLLKHIVASRREHLCPCHHERLTYSVTVPEEHIILEETLLF